MTIKESRDREGARAQRGTPLPSGPKAAWRGDGEAGERFPFAAIVGQEDLKLALLLNAVNPAIGGVLIRGEKGTAKSTAARGLAELLPPIRVVAGCPFNCDPDAPWPDCPHCSTLDERPGCGGKGRGWGGEGGHPPPRCTAVPVERWTVLA